MAIEWTTSAGKHGVTEREAFYAITNHHVLVPGFDDSRVVNGVNPDLYIGPSRLGGPLLEIMVLRVPPRTVMIFHAMPVREKFLHLLKEES